MGDAAAQVAPSPAPVPVLSAEDRQVEMLRNREAMRQSRRAGAVAKLQAAHAEAPPTEAAVEPSKAVIAETVKPIDPAKPAAVTVADTIKPAETSAAEDEATKRGLAQIEHARKRFLDEQNAWKAQQAVHEAEVARLRQEAQGKVSSIDELKKLDIPTLLDKLALDDTRHAQLSRESYFRTAEGQKNPAAKQAVDDVRQRTSVATMEERYSTLEKSNAELKAELEATRKLIFQREYANEWVDGAVKELPADKPTLFAKLLAKNPKGARATLLSLAGELEKTGGDAAPTSAEVLAEYEKRQRAFLEAQGFDVDTLLAVKPAVPTVSAAPAAKPATRTLNVNATQITRSDALPKTREERRNDALAKLRMRQRQTADQVS